MLPVDSPSRLGGEPEMAAAIAVKGAEYAFALDYFLQPSHHGHGRFLLRELRVIDLAGGIVQNHDQVIPALVLEPLVMTAVDMQQHAGQRPPWAPACDAPPAASAAPPAPTLARPPSPSCNSARSRALHPTSGEHDAR